MITLDEMMDQTTGTDTQETIESKFCVCLVAYVLSLPAPASEKDYMIEKLYKEQIKIHTFISWLKSY